MLVLRKPHVSQRHLVYAAGCCTERSRSITTGDSTGIVPSIKNELIPVLNAVVGSNKERRRLLVYEWVKKRSIPATDVMQGGKREMLYLSPPMHLQYKTANAKNLNVSTLAQIQHHTKANFIYQLQYRYYWAPLRACRQLRIKMVRISTNHKSQFNWNVNTLISAYCLT